MNTLAKPAGPHLVGTVAFELADPERTTHVASSDQGRRLFVKLWYPADRSAAKHRRERLWEQLRHERHVPAIVKLLLKPAMRVLTNSHVEAAYEATAGAPRVLIYCHGLISFASENTILMEHLASHGFVVVSIQHLHQLTELRALQASQSKAMKAEQSRIERKIKSSLRDRRAELSREYFRIASNTNRIVAARSADIGFVVSEMQAAMKKIPEVDHAAETRVVGAIGLSLGGAVVTEFSKRNWNQVRCVVNLDGGHYGELQEEPVRIPYLMLYSEENEGINDSALNAVSGIDLARNTIPGTRHLNFHDISVIYPVMKWIRAIGPADPRDAVRLRNQIVHEFIRGADA